MIDPFTQVYRYVFDQLKNNIDLASIVPASNFIDYTRQRVGQKGALAPNDFPSILVAPAGGEIQLKWTSDGGRILQVFEISVATGDVALSRTDSDVQNLYFPLKWLILKALFPLVGNGPFQSTDINFGISNLRVVSAEETIVDADRGKDGWFAVFNVEVDILIPRTVFGETYSQVFNL